MKIKEVLQQFRHVFIKRKHKDILFRYVFRDKRDILDLYNAVNKTNYTDPEKLAITTMEDVIYVGMKNDLSFLIANEMNLYEHQSTLNQNMPLRGLLYIARMYESYIETHRLNRYQKQLIPLPFPRFVVFYNGEEGAPEEREMRLSEAFEKKEEEPAVECVARFLNINYGNNRELMEKCRRLHDYAYFIECIRNYLRKGHSQKEAIVYATEECIEQGILEDVLRKHRAEVVDMFLTTFNKKEYEEAIKLDAIAEGLEQGLEQGREQGLEQGRVEGRMEALIETCQEFGLTTEQVVEKIVKKFEVDRSFAEEQVEKHWK